VSGGCSAHRHKGDSPDDELSIFGHFNLQKCAGRAQSCRTDNVASVMAVGRDLFRDHEGDDPLVEGLVVRVASSIRSLCGPAGSPLMMNGSPPVSAQRQGASSTGTWMCPMRGDTARAFGPNTGTIRRFSARYWMTTRPWTSFRGGPHLHTVEQRSTRTKPERMIGDRAYDCDALGLRRRQKHGIRLIAPHKYNRRRKNIQDGRELRRYCRR
jgi:hypothetical protein